MELVLNLAWALLAAALMAAWLRFGLRHGANRGAQLIALAVLVLILFPVISVTDDLWAAQNPAEADCCLRRDHVVAAVQSDLPALAAMVQPPFAELAQPVLRFAAPGDLPAPVEDHAGFSVIDNRPPPAA